MTQSCSISNQLQELVDQANCNNRPQKLPTLEANFVRAGFQRKPEKKTVHNKSTLLDGATDWKLLVDFDSERIVYPPEITATAERLDIVIWSKQLKVATITTLAGESGVAPASRCC